jgi:hypothetical protein
MFHLLTKLCSATCSAVLLRESVSATIIFHLPKLCFATCSAVLHRESVIIVASHDVI